MKKLIFLIFFFFLFISPALAINPPGPNVRPIPPVIFLMGDWINGNYGNPDFVLSKEWNDKYAGERGYHHLEWGPVGGWFDFQFGSPRRAGRVDGATITEYIKDAAKMTVTLDDGTKILKPVGVGIGFTLENIKDYIYLNDVKEFPNLAFIVASAPYYPGCAIHGEVTECVDQWAEKIMRPLSDNFPNIPIFFQGTINTLGGLVAQAATMPNKNIAVKANGWAPNLIFAHKTVNGISIGGEMTFADLYHDRIMVGFEPQNEFPIKETYWTAMNALSEHADFFDIQWSVLNNMADFGKTYGFPLLRFTRDHMAKTINNSPDVWLVLRETPYIPGKDNCRCTMVPSCSGWACECWTQSIGFEQVKICTGPEWGNFSFFLYQKEVSGGKTVTEILPQTTQAHPYSLGNRVRRTDQATGNVFMAFDVDDGYRTHQAKPKAAGGESVLDITVTFVNKGNDSLSLEYKNYSGDLIKKTIQKGPALGTVDNWVDYTFTVDDAYFNNNLDGGVDFRINCENDGDEYIHRVIVKSVSCPSEESGNLNSDCLINEKDLTILLSQWQESSAGLLRALFYNWKSKY